MDPKLYSKDGVVYDFASLHFKFFAYGLNVDNERERAKTRRGTLKATELRLVVRSTQLAIPYRIANKLERTTEGQHLSRQPSKLRPGMEPYQQVNIAHSPVTRTLTDECLAPGMQGFPNDARGTRILHFAPWYGSEFKSSLLAARDHITPGRSQKFLTEDNHEHRLPSKGATTEITSAEPDNAGDSQAYRPKLATQQRHGQKAIQLYRTSSIVSTAPYQPNTLRSASHAVFIARTMTTLLKSVRKRSPLCQHSFVNGRLAEKPATTPQPVQNGFVATVA
ncbi:hypothetical protein B0T10DRAFT_456267 [Thelonectria olida]|uniref:Uncharacterized protein n=1 Tax=Thelonectria olida TaxID=1576542 RepID=A0A9P8WF88_9HYPO|nr:hypothetical protein B0T10DRAFT_456267 [Thelonectria olida]